MILVFICNISKPNTEKNATEKFSSKAKFLEDILELMRLAYNMKFPEETRETFGLVRDEKMIRDDYDCKTCDNCKNCPSCKWCDFIGCWVNPNCKYCKNGCKECVKSGFCGKVCGYDLPDSIPHWGWDCK